MPTAGISGWVVSSLKYLTVMVMPLVTCISLSERADISPFAALRGYDERLASEKQRTERVTKRILTEEEMSALSDRLMQVTRSVRCFSAASCSS